MAKLPQAIDMPGPNGAVTRGTAVDFRSIEQAFETAGREVARFDETRKAVNDEIAGRELEAVRQTYEAGAIERASLYDGRSPGFAAAELQAFDASIAPLLAREDIDDGVRDSLTRQSRDLRVRVGGSAVATEARARGARSAADRDASEQAQAYQALMAFDALFDGLEDERRAEWDGASPGFAEGLAGDFAFAREKVLENLPPAVAERVRSTLTSREVTLRAGAMAQEDEARDAGVMRTAVEGVRGLSNRAARDPSILNRWEEEFAPIRAMLPAHLRAEAEAEAKQDVFSRGLETRIENGDFEAVRAEIDAGAYDWMDPGRVEQLRSGIETADAVRTVEDAQAEADLLAEIDADLTGILSGGQADPTLVARAQALGGPDLALKVQTDQQAAQRVRPLMGRLRAMTPQQVAAELETLTAQAGDAVGARTLELARALIDQDRSLRGGDPAAWTTTPIGPGDRVATDVRGRLVAYESQPTPQNAQAYARATWTAQQAGGVALLDRRILPRAMAEAWVESVEEPGAASAALPALAVRIDGFGPGFRGQIVRELGLAGLKPSDLGALTHYSRNPARMAQYARGRTLRPNDAIPKAEDRRSVDAALRASLAPHAAALSTGDGSTATFEAARVVAYGLVAQGVPMDQAVRQATQPMLDGWDFKGSWAIPTTAGLDTRRVSNGASTVVRDLTRDNGRGLIAPPSSRYTPEQSRRTYADIVSEHGQWRNLNDGSGVELVVPAADGRGWIRVRDAAGRDVTRTWRQLETTESSGGPSGRLGFN